MPAPTKNTNARKGEENRKMWAHRLPLDVHKTIKAQAKAKGLSQADYITALVRQSNKSLQLIPRCWGIN